MAILGVGIGGLMGGAVFVEIIFNRPGLGPLIFDAISEPNYPVVQGGVWSSSPCSSWPTSPSTSPTRLDPRIARGSRVNAVLAMPPCSGVSAPPSRRPRGS